MIIIIAKVFTDFCNFTSSWIFSVVHTQPVTIFLSQVGFTQHFTLFSLVMNIF